MRKLVVLALVAAAAVAPSPAAAAVVRCTIGDPLGARASAFSPDGRSVGFFLADPAGWTLAAAPATTPWGTATDLIGNVTTNPPDAFAWSPDLRHVAFTVSGQLLVAERDGAPPRRLEDTSTSIRLGGWSPDGTRFVYAVGETIRVADAITGATRDLATGSEPAWAPGGAWIAYVRRAGDESELVLVRPEGSVERIVVRGAGVYHPVWSPDSRRLLYLRAASFPSVHVVDLASGSDRQVTEVVGDELAWRPTGVFHTQADDDNDIWVARLNPETRRDVVFTHLPPDSYSARLLDVSPDGRVVVYAATRGEDGPTGVRVVDHGRDRPLLPCRGTPRPDLVVGTDLNDRISVVGGGRDRVRCGRGRDVVVLGGGDRAARDCERVLH